MQIIQANATYGKLNQAQLSLQSGLNIICAPNEGGKSTWSRFLLTMFYGLNTRQRGDLADKNRFQPWNGSQMQGRLELSVGEDLLTLSRRTQRADAPMGAFSCTYTGTDTPAVGIDASHCGELLIGVPQSVYQRCAFISSGSMAIDADADLERRISALISSGEEKVSFSQAESRLKRQLHQRKYNRTGAIPQLESDIATIAAAQNDVEALIRQEALLQQQLSAATQAQNDSRLAKQQELQQRINEKQHRLQNLPDSAALQDINEQLGAVRSAAMQAQQEQDSVQAQQQRIQELQQELSKNPLHPITKAELDAQLQIQPKAPPQIAQLLISLALALCGGGVLWYALGLSHTLLLCISCVVTGLAAGNFLRLLISRVRLQQARRLEQQRQAELLHLAEAYLPLLEDLDAQQTLLQQQKQSAEDSEQRLRLLLTEVLAQVHLWAPEARTATDIREFVLHSSRQKEALTEEIRQAQTELLQAQRGDADESLLRLQRQIAQVQGQLTATGSPEEAEHRLSRKQEQLQQLQAEYDAIAMALDALRSANTSLHNRFSPELGRRAAEIFSQMTDSGWGHIQLDREFHLSAESSEDSVRRNVQILSSGTADQLYLATRLAICEMVLPEAQNAPLILDDALLTFDDRRLHKTLDYLAQLGSKRQILLFTCQRREADYLRSRTDVHIIYI